MASTLRETFNKHECNKVQPEVKVKKVNWPGTRLCEPQGPPRGNPRKILNEHSETEKKPWSPIFREVTHIRAERLNRNRVEWEITGDKTGEYVWAEPTSFNAPDNVLEEWISVTQPAIVAAEAEMKNSLKKKEMESQASGQVMPKQESPNDVSPKDVPPEDVSPNDVSPNDVSANDVFPNDVSANDVYPNDVSPNEVSPKDVSQIDASPKKASTQESSFKKTIPIYEQALKKSPLVIAAPKIKKILCHTIWNGHKTFICQDEQDRMVIVLKDWLMKKYSSLWTKYWLDQFMPKPIPKVVVPNTEDPSTSSSHGRGP